MVRRVLTRSVYGTCVGDAGVSKRVGDGEVTEEDVDMSMSVCWCLKACVIKL